MCRLQSLLKHAPHLTPDLLLKEEKEEEKPTCQTVFFPTPCGEQLIEYQNSHQSSQKHTESWNQLS